jgi:hypothetical protein
MFSTIIQEYTQIPISPFIANDYPLGLYFDSGNLIPQNRDLGTMYTIKERSKEIDFGEIVSLKCGVVFRIELN